MKMSTISAPFAFAIVLAVMGVMIPSFAFASQPASDVAQLAKAAQRGDIVGIKLGMPLKEAMQALKAHNPKLQLKTETIKVPTVAEPLVYSISANTPEEQFYFTLTLPPNPIVISRVGRQMVFTKETAPTQQVVVEELIKKYGQPSSDSGPDQLTASFRLIVWYFDADGKPIKPVEADYLFDSFFSGGNSVAIGPLSLAEVQNRLQSAHNFEGDPNTKRRMIQARLQSGVTIGVSSPDVVSRITVTMGDGLLEQAGYRATSRMITENARAAQQQQTKSAEKNRPKF